MNLLQKIGLGAIALLIAIGSAFYLSQKVTVDNPTAQTITVKIDDTEYTVEPRKQIEISLYPGEHNVLIAEKEMGIFQKQWFDYGSLLNPTQSTYILESIPYGTVPESWSDNSYKDIDINGQQYYGPFEVITDLYFAKKQPLNFLQKKGYEWNYGLDQHEPEEETINTKSAYEVFVKIYRFDDFIEMYNEDYL